MAEQSTDNTSKQLFVTRKPDNKNVDGKLLSDYGLQTPIEKLKEEFQTKIPGTGNAAFKAYLSFYHSILQQLRGNGVLKKYFNSDEEFYNTTVATSFGLDPKGNPHVLKFYNVMDTLKKYGSDSTDIENKSQFIKEKLEKIFGKDSFANVDGDAKSVIDGIINGNLLKKVSIVSDNKVEFNLPSIKKGENTWKHLGEGQSYLETGRKYEQIQQEGGTENKKQKQPKKQKKGRKDAAQTNSPKYYDIANPENQETVGKYLKKCGDLEKLYIKKHIEYMTMFVFIRELIKCNYDLNLAIQAVTQLKGKNEDGSVVTLEGIEGITLPKSIASNMEQLLAEQKYLSEQVDEKLSLIQISKFSKTALEKTGKQIYNKLDSGTQGRVTEVLSNIGNNIEKYNNLPAEIKQHILSLLKLQQNQNTVETTVETSGGGGGQVGGGNGGEIAVIAELLQYLSLLPENIQKELIEIADKISTVINKNADIKGAISASEQTNASNTEQVNTEQQNNSSGIKIEIKVEEITVKTTETGEGAPAQPENSPAAPAKGASAEGATTQPATGEGAPAQPAAAEGAPTTEQGGGGKTYEITITVTGTNLEGVKINEVKLIEDGSTNQVSIDSDNISKVQGSDNTWTTTVSEGLGDANYRVYVEASAGDDTQKETSDVIILNKTSLTKEEQKIQTELQSLQQTFDENAKNITQSHERNNKLRASLMEAATKKLSQFNSDNYNKLNEIFKLVDNFKGDIDKIIESTTDETKKGDKSARLNGFLTYVNGLFVGLKKGEGDQYKVKGSFLQVLSSVEEQRKKLNKIIQETETTELKSIERPSGSLVKETVNSYNAAIAKQAAKLAELEQENTMLKTFGTALGDESGFKFPELTEDIATKIIGKLNAKITVLNEELIGSARVIVKYRDDDLGIPGKLKDKGDKIVVKSEGGSCLEMLNKDCGGLCDKLGNKRRYGPFKHVFDETQDNGSTKKLFEKAFLDDGIIDSLLGIKTNDGGAKEKDDTGPKSAVIFGFGFSGSGKTFQLAEAGNADNILAQTISSLLEGKKVGETTYQASQIDIDVEELYPYTDTDANEIYEGVKLYTTKDNDKETYIEAMRQKKPNDNEQSEPLKLSVSSVEDLSEVYQKFAEIERERINNMRISPTPNNDVSSRSHIFYILDFAVEGHDGKKGRFVIVDMAGAENTIEIRKDFLIGEEISKVKLKNKSGTSTQVYVKVPSFDIKPFHFDENNKPEMAAACKEISGNNIFKNKVSAFAILKYVQDNFTYEQDKEDYKGQNGLSASLGQNYLKLSILGNKKNFSANLKDFDPDKPKRPGVVSVNTNLEKISLTGMFTMYNTFVSKIESSYEFNDSNDMTYQEINNGDFVLNVIEKIFKDENTGFNPYKVLYMNDNWDGEDGWKSTVRRVLQNKYSLKKISGDDIKNLSSSDYGKTYDNHKNKYLLGLDKVLHTSDKGINYKNPLQIILSAFILRIIDSYASLINITTDSSEDMLLKKRLININDGGFKDSKKAINISIIVLILGVISHYVNIIVNQGKGIVTTLEHLKYFFLYNTAEHQKLKDYNEAEKAKKEKESSKLLKYLSGVDKKGYTITSGDGMEEFVQTGFMDKYKILELLCKYATKDETLKIDNQGVKRNGKLIPGGDNTEFLTLPPPEGNKYIMLTAILRGKAQKENGKRKAELVEGENEKYCMATKNTLEFAQSITSAPEPCPEDLGPKDKPYKYSHESKENFKFCSASAASSGGGKFSHKNKRNYGKSNKRSKLNKKYRTQRGGDLEELKTKIQETKDFTLANLDTAKNTYSELQSDKNVSEENKKEAQKLMQDLASKVVDTIDKPDKFVYTKPLADQVVPIYEYLRQKSSRRIGEIEKLTDKQKKNRIYTLKLLLERADKSIADKLDDIGGDESKKTQTIKQYYHKVLAALILKGKDIFQKLTSVKGVENDAAISINDVKFIERKKSTVENFFDKFLQPVFKSSQDINITKALLAQKKDESGANIVGDSNKKNSKDITNSLAYLKKLQSGLGLNLAPPETTEGAEAAESAVEGVVEGAEENVLSLLGGGWESTNSKSNYITYFKKPTELNGAELKGKALQQFLDRCQDLEMEYVVKHMELFELVKPMLYFLDTIAKNIMLYAYILSLYENVEKVGKIEWDQSDIQMKTFQTAIKDLTSLVKTQKDVQGIIQKTTQEGLEDKEKETLSDISGEYVDLRQASKGGNRKNSKKRRRKLTRKGNKQRNSAKNRYNKVRKVRKNVRKTKRN